MSVEFDDIKGELLDVIKAQLPTYDGYLSEGFIRLDIYNDLHGNNMRPFCEKKGSYSGIPLLLLFDEKTNEIKLLAAKPIFEKALVAYNKRRMEEKRKNKIVDFFKFFKRKKG